MLGACWITTQHLWNDDTIPQTTSARLLFAKHTWFESESTCDTCSHSQSGIQLGTALHRPSSKELAAGSNTFLSSGLPAYVQHRDSRCYSAILGVGVTPVTAMSAENSSTDCTECHSVQVVTFNIMYATCMDCCDAFPESLVCAVCMLHSCSTICCV